MIENSSKLHKYNLDAIRKEKLTYRQALMIYEQLHKEAVSLGAINSRNILDGIETDIRVARILNSRKNDRKPH